VTINEDDSNTPSLLNATTGAVLSEGGDLSARLDGDSATVFHRRVVPGNNQLTRYSLATNAVAVGQTAAGTDAALDHRARWQRRALRASCSTEQPETRTMPRQAIIAVTSDGRLALSATGVYDVAPGAAWARFRHDIGPRPRAGRHEGIPVQRRRHHHRRPGRVLTIPLWLRSTLELRKASLRECEAGSEGARGEVCGLRTCRVFHGEIDLTKRPLPTDRSVDTRRNPRRH
jgi:hypothetical protein